MAEKITDLSTGKEVVMLSIYDISRAIGADAVIIDSWRKNDEIVTPPAKFEFQNRSFWNSDDIEAWKALWDNHIAKGLEKSYSRRQLIDLVIAEAKETERFARRSYNRSPSYPKMKAREKVVVLEGLWRFVVGMGNYIEVPKEKRDEYNSLLRLAKGHLNMQQ